MPAADGAKILEFAKGKLKTQVGTGECFDLADAAIKDQKAKSADAYGEVRPDADYVWGEKIANVISAAPGDILQFKDYEVSITVERAISLNLEGGDGIDYGGATDTTGYKRPHHTAIVVSGVADNQIKVIEQNVERGAGGTKERKVDFGSNYVTAPGDSEEKSDLAVTISTQWGEALKKQYNDPEYSAKVDALVRKYNGKTFQAKVTKTTKVSVSGTINAFRVQMPDPPN